MNLGLSKVLIDKYPNIIPIDRLLVETVKDINNNWLSGFIEGEGCFYVRIRQSKPYKTGYNVELNFILFYLNILGTKL